MCQIWKFFGSVCFVHTQITYKRSLIQYAAKQYLSDIHWKIKATKCMKGMLSVSQDTEMLSFMRTSFIHLTKLPTAHSSIKTIWWQDATRWCQRWARNSHHCNHYHRFSREFTFSGNKLWRYFYATSEKPWCNQTEKSTRNISSEECFTSESFAAENEDQQSVKEALGGNNSEKWKETLDAEYSSLISNETWELVPPPKDANVVGSKWVLKVKRDADGNINRYKARLVAQGYSQTQGVDYEFLSCCQILKYQSTGSLGKCIWLEVHQMDVKTAFLIGSNSRPWLLHVSTWRIYCSRSSWLCVQAKEKLVWPQAVR